MFHNKKIYSMSALVFASALFAAGFTTRAAAMESVKQAEDTRSDEAEGQHAFLLYDRTTGTTIESMCTSLYEELQEAVVQEKNRQEEARIQEELRLQEEARLQEEEEELLASIIFCEAGNQSYTGQVAVGAVVMNRLHDSAYPDSIEGVIYQKGQFAPVATGWLDRVRSSNGYTDSALSAAKDALNGANPVGSCLFFDRGGSGQKIGDHYFH